MPQPRDAAPLIAKWRERHPEDTKSADDMVLSRIQEKYPGKFDDVRLTTRPHPFTLVDRANAALKSVDEGIGKSMQSGVGAGLYGAANTALGGIPEMALKSKGIEPPHGLAEKVGSAAGFFLGAPAKVGGMAARATGGVLKKAVSRASPFTRELVAGPRSVVRGMAEGAASFSAAGATAPGDVGERATRAAFFAPVGATFGSIAPAAKAIFGRRGFLESGARQTRLGDLQQGRVTKRLEQGTTRAAQGIDESLVQTTSRLKNQQIQLEGLMRHQSTAAAQRLQAEVPSYLESARTGYDNAIKEGFSKLGTATTLTRKAVEASLQKVSQKYPNQVGFLLGQLFPKGAKARPAHEVYKVMQKTLGGKHKGPSGMFADDAKTALIEAVEKEGGTTAFSEARSFWADVAPFRDRLVKFAKPYRGAQYETPRVAEAIGKAVRDPTKGSFVREIQNRLGLPLTEELERTVGKLTKTQQDVVRAKLNASGLKEQISSLQKQLGESGGEKTSRKMFQETTKLRTQRRVATSVGGAAAAYTLYRIIGGLLNAATGQGGGQAGGN